jgi:hypothetical protein
MTDHSFEFDAELWLYPGKAAWVFATVPTDVADEILDVAPPAAGFGSVKVLVGIGGTEWSTSLFPDKSAGSFVLPIKRSVRDAESVDVGDSVRVRLSLVASR